MSKKSLSKKVQEVLAGATPKQKALLVSKEYFEATTMMYKNVLTDKEIDAIKDSLKTDQERSIYNRYLRIYDFYADITPMCGLVYKEYQTEAETLLGLLREWESYDQEENHLTQIYNHIQAIEPKEAKDKAIAAFKEVIPLLNFKKRATIKLSEADGYPEITIDGLYKDIEEEIIHLTNHYKIAKAFVMIVEAYAKKTKSEKFFPEMTQTAIDAIKEDYVLRISPRYSRAELKKRIDRGMNVTEEDKKRAVFPSYDEIEPTKEELATMEDRIMYYKKF